MNRLAERVAESLANSQMTGTVIRAGGYGSTATELAEVIGDSLVVQMNKGWAKEFSPSTRLKLLVISDPVIDQAADEEEMDYPFLIPEQKNNRRSELAKEVYQRIKGKEQIPIPPKDPDRAVRNVITSMMPDLDKQIFQLAKTFPMYSEQTLARILVMSSYEIYFHIREEMNYWRIVVPGQMEEKTAELEEKVWEVIKQEKGY